MSSPYNPRVSNLQHELTPNAAVAARAVTISNAAATLETLGNFTLHADTNHVLVTIEAQPVRTDPSGAAPTTTIGQPRLASREVLLSRAEARLAKWIKSGATDATAQVTEYL